jgi:hypothetical protein
MVQDFTLEAKSGFSGSETNFLRLPAPLNAIEEDVLRGIADGEILITPDDMVEMFEFPIRRVYEVTLGSSRPAVLARRRSSTSSWSAASQNRHTCTARSRPSQKPMV